jgi:hypothetical protein
MKIIITILLAMIPLYSYSSSPLEVSMEELVKNSDHLLVGYVIGVDMIDGRGNEISDLEAMTGPGIDNLIRLLVKVDEVLLSYGAIPSVVKIPLDPFMHYRFGDIKEAHSTEGEKFLLLLKGDNLQPPFPGVFSRGISEKEEIMRLMKSNKSLKDAP